MSTIHFQCKGEFTLSGSNKSNVDITISLGDQHKTENCKTIPDDVTIVNTTQDTTNDIIPNTNTNQPSRNNIILCEDAKVEVLPEPSLYLFNVFDHLVNNISAVIKNNINNSMCISTTA